MVYAAQFVYMTSPTWYQMVYDDEEEVFCSNGCAINYCRCGNDDYENKDDEIDELFYTKLITDEKRDKAMRTKREKFVVKKTVKELGYPKLDHKVPSRIKNAKKQQRVKARRELKNQAF